MMFNLQYRYRNGQLTLSPGEGARDRGGGIHEEETGRQPQGKVLYFPSCLF
jgi:hypothetical protein